MKAFIHRFLSFLETSSFFLSLNGFLQAGQLISVPPSSLIRCSRLTIPEIGQTSARIVLMQDDGSEPIRTFDMRKIRLSRSHSNRKATASMERTGKETSRARRAESKGWQSFIHSGAITKMFFCVSLPYSLLSSLRKLTGRTYSTSSTLTAVTIATGGAAGAASCQRGDSAAYAAPSHLDSSLIVP